MEANNHGLTTLNQIENEGYPQHKIYHRTHTPDGSSYGTPQPGWKTTTITRLNLIDRTAQAIRDHSIIFRSQETQTEFFAFIIKASGKVEANVGFKDDRVFSSAIAIQMISQYPLDSLDESDEPDFVPSPSSYRPAKYKYQ